MSKVNIKAAGIYQAQTQSVLGIYAVKIISSIFKITHFKLGPI